MFLLDILLFLQIPVRNLSLCRDKLKKDEMFRDCYYGIRSRFSLRKY